MSAFCIPNNQHTHASETPPSTITETSWIDRVANPFNRSIDKSTRSRLILRSHHTRGKGHVPLADARLRPPSTDDPSCPPALRREAGRPFPSVVRPHLVIILFYRIRQCFGEEGEFDGLSIGWDGVASNRAAGFDVVRSGAAVAPTERTTPHPPPHSARARSLLLLAWTRSERPPENNIPGSRQCAEDGRGFWRGPAPLLVARSVPFFCLLLDPTRTR